MVFDRTMPTELSKPGVDELTEALRVLRGWQHDGMPVQLHSGDLGWQRRFGAAATAEAVRTWSRDGRTLAIGMLDSPELLRVAIAPEADHDEELAARMLADLTTVLPKGDIYAEARFGAAFRKLLAEDGWESDEPWTPLRRNLAEPVEDCGLRIETIGPDRAEVRAMVQRAAFDRSTFTTERWHDMAAGPEYANARCLVAYDDQDAAVAAATVWSAGPGRAGLLEPVGVHRDHRHRGYGRAVSVAAAGALREMGASSAIVCTRSSNVGAVATYRSAGFEELPAVSDFRRTV